MKSLDLTDGNHCIFCNQDIDYLGFFTDKRKGPYCSDCIHEIRDPDDFKMDPDFGKDALNA